MAAGVWLATPAWADPFFFSSGTPDGLLGASSQPASADHPETETADDFILTETASISQATITGLIQRGTPLASISNVEVEIYHRRCRIDPIRLDTLWARKHKLHPLQTDRRTGCLR